MIVRNAATKSSLSVRVNFLNILIEDWVCRKVQPARLNKMPPFAAEPPPSFRIGLLGAASEPRLIEIRDFQRSVRENFPAVQKGAFQDNYIGQTKVHHIRGASFVLSHKLRAKPRSVPENEADAWVCGQAVGISPQDSACARPKLSGSHRPQSHTFLP